MKKLSLRLALLAGATLVPALASAAPILNIRAFDITGGGSTAIALTGSQAGDALYVSSGPTSNFSSLFVGANGASLSNGGLSTTTVDASATAGAVLRLEITQSNLPTTLTSQPFSMTFTLNTLTAGSLGATAAFTDFVNSSNTPFGMTAADQLGPTMTIGGTPNQYGTDSNSLATGLTAGGFYSETQRIDITFNSNGSVTASSQIIPVSVPEPATLTILGSTLVGVGLVRRRRKTA